jgi:hypothetical protein
MSLCTGCPARSTMRTAGAGLSSDAGGWAITPAQPGRPTRAAGPATPTGTPAPGRKPRNVPSPNLAHRPISSLHSAGGKDQVNSQAVIAQTRMDRPLEGKALDQAYGGRIHHDNSGARVCCTRHPAGTVPGLLGLVVTVGEAKIVADRAGLLGQLVAALTCGGGAAAAQSLESVAQMLRSQEQTA